MFKIYFLVIGILLVSVEGLIRHGDYRRHHTRDHLTSSRHGNTHRNVQTVFATLDPEVPDGRPAPGQRKFNSSTLEEAIVRVSAKIRDETIRKIFINCLPSTLDTTVYYHKTDGPRPYSYIVTGDILAMWLRDSTYQVNPYVQMAKDGPELFDLVHGVINTQAEMILLYPFGNAYFPLKSWDSGINLNQSDASKTDDVSPLYAIDEVFEAKYELDSLASFLYLSKYFWEETGATAFVENQNWVNAMRLAVATMKDQQGGTVEVISNPPFSFTRYTRTQSETQNLYGFGNPVKRCGLIRSFFRPSDDSTIFQYLIPSNAMAVVGLEGVARILDSLNVHQDLSTEMKTLASEVRAAITRHAIVQHPEFGQVYAFEVDCYGSHVFMDDANFPSLLSFPKFGFVPKDDPIYLQTRKYILSPEWNPYYAQGLYSGIGSPHTGLQKPWHMAQAMQAMTSSNETEIYELLWTLRNTTAGTGFMHESYNVNDPNSYSRSWFAWANTVFGDLILHLEKEYPHILEM